MIADNVWGYLSTLIGVIGTPKVTKYMMTSSLRLFAVLLIPTLFIYMTAVLNRKRKLAKKESPGFGT